MAVNDKGAGPKVGQPVWYNNAGVIQAAIITGVNASGTVSVVSCPPNSATWANFGTAGYSPGAQTQSTWGYPDFF